MTNTIGEQIDIFQASPNGRHVLNLTALTTLIDWAEGSEALAARFGTWDQGQWAQAILNPGVDASDEIDTAKVTEETRNGVCETAYCMAGQTVVQAGYRLIYRHYGYDEDGKMQFNTSDCIKQKWTGRRRANGTPIMEDTGEVMAISTAAGQILGLDYDENNSFFDGDNDIDDLKHMVNAMCERRGLPEPYPEADSERAQDMVEMWPDRVGG
jgi:hypothetical protein